MSEAINDSSKLVAQVLDIVKKAVEAGVVNMSEMQLSQNLLEEALEKMTKAM
jgi:hypothetical protein